MEMPAITLAGKSDFAEITEVWEASVRATHHFLPEEYITFLRPLILNEYLHAVTVYCIRNQENRIIAFMGLANRCIEMLFIHPSERGKGWGKKLVRFATTECKANRVDVNEQNDQALQFYLKMGFVVTGRDALDGNGRPYPILHMELEEKPTELHPLGYFLPENTRLLMLGSFPPKQIRWSMNFYYPNIQNDMWRIMGVLFYNDKDHFLVPGKKAFSEEKARAFCMEKGIGIGDTAEEVIRLKDNASDKFLEVVKPMDAERVFNQIPDCVAVVITGQKAMDTFLSVVPATEPKVGAYTTFVFQGKEMRLYRMPSSSRAYPRPLEEKAGYYGKMFREIGLL